MALVGWSFNEAPGDLVRGILWANARSRTYVWETDRKDQMQLFIPAQGPPPELTLWAAAIGGFAPVATFLVVAVAFLAYRQKTNADKRAEWWKRAQWAIDNSLSEDAQKQDVGLTVLENLGKSGLATKEDSALFEEVSSAVYGEYLDEELDAALAEEVPAGDNEETNGEGGTDAKDHDG